jgi:glycosyltransferase involved in cell wall biosynthesis
MKIAILNKYQNKVSRGAETFVYELSKRLSKNNEVDVISDINYFKILKKKYDFIIPTNGRLQAIIIRKIAWLTGAKVIISGQSGIGWDDKLNLLTFPNAFVALSGSAEIWAKKFNPFVKVVKIPNGVDLNRFKNIDLGVKKGTKTILCVGAATKQKRLDLVINAVAKLENVNLLVVSGGGDLKNKIYDLGIKNLGKESFEMISVSYDKMPNVYNRADLFTLPSASSESFGNVLVEAMASGLSVVATDDSIRKEIIGDAGILVDPVNTEEYARALRKALDINWGEKPRKQAEKFSWDEIAESYKKLFTDLVTKK